MKMQSFTFKKIFLFIIIQLMCMPMFAAKGEFLIESVTPASASVFVKTIPVRNFLQSINGFINSTFTASQKKDLLSFADDFKTKTGIDFLNESHLRKAGVDVSKPIACAYANADRHEEKMMLFIPVLDPKTAPMKIAQLLNPDDNAKPVISKYNDIEIYRLNGIFYFPIAVYCVISSNEDFAKQAIDLSTGKGSALNADPMYKKYLSNINKKNEINAYVKPNVLGDVEKMLDLGSKDTPVIEYISFGFSINSSKIGAVLGVEYNGDNPQVASYIDLLKPGNTATSLYNSQMLIYGMLSLDPEKLKALLTSEEKPKDALSSKSTPLPKDALSNEVTKLNRSTGLDLVEEFLPNMVGTFNIYMENPLTGDYVIYVPMKDAAKTKTLMTKFQAAMKAKHEPEKKFGATTIAKAPGFWVRNPNNKRTFYCSNARGVFLGTNSDLIAKVMGFQTVSAIKTKDATLSKMDANLFMIARVRKNDLLGQLIVAQLSRHGLVSAGDMADLSKAASKIGDIFLTGVKKKNYIEFQFDVSLPKTPAKK